MPIPGKAKRGDLFDLITLGRFEPGEVDRLRQVRLPAWKDPVCIESIDQLWATVGHFGLTGVAEAAGVEPARLRDALADLASQEIEGARSPVRRSLDRWRRRWPWRLTAILLLLILGAGSLYLETRQSHARSQTGGADAPTERVVLTLPATPESLPGPRPGERVSLLLTAPPEGTVAPTLPGFLDDVLLLEIRSEPSPAVVVAVPVELLRELAPLPSGLRASVVRSLTKEDGEAGIPEPAPGSRTGSKPGSGSDAGSGSGS